MRETATAGGTDKLQKEWPHDPTLARVGVVRSALKSGGQRPPVGDAAHLDKALQEEVPKAALLADVREGLRLKYDKLKEKFPDAIGDLPYFVSVRWTPWWVVVLAGRARSAK